MTAFSTGLSFRSNLHAIIEMDEMENKKIYMHQKFVHDF